MHRRVLSCLGLAAVFATLTSAALAASWGTAIEVPGTAALNAGGNAQVYAVSCVAAGSCAAGGAYEDSSGRFHAFVADEQSGAWGTAVEPDTSSLDLGSHAWVDTISCASAGNCAAGGLYLDGSSAFQAFVVDETNGAWGAATKVSGTATLNASGYAQVESISCASAGDCTAAGFYRDGSGAFQAFVVGETGGAWGTANALGLGSYSSATSVSCGSAGNCVAVGDFRDGSSRLQGFVVSEKSGVWGTATKAPGTAPLNLGGNAHMDSVSCGRAGDCTAGGYYTGSNGGHQAFVVAEHGGRWTAAIRVPGTATLNKGRFAEVTSVSCRGAGNCAAGGYYTTSDSRPQPFVVVERSGMWRSAITVPGMAALDVGRNSAVASVSCAGVGNCAAAGTYRDSSGTVQAFVVSQTSGAWGHASEVPGTAALNVGGDIVLAGISCAKAGTCAIGGAYSDGTGGTQAFVTG